MNPAALRAALTSLLVVSAAAAAEVPSDLQVFLLIGQSNMAGRGTVEADDLVPDPRVLMLTKDLAWVPAVDPLHYDKPGRIGTGLGKTFGLVVAEARPGTVIGLVPAAFGGSSLDEWAPGQPHYVNAVARAKEALKHGRLAGIRRAGSRRRTGGRAPRAARCRSRRGTRSGSSGSATSS